MQATTGEVVSRLGVLTVLTHNCLEENALPPEVEARARKEMERLLKGKTGQKVMRRSVERCVIGGSSVGFGPVSWGWN